MKRITLLVLATLLSFVLPLACHAQDHQYLLQWRGTVYTTNAEGRVIARPYSEKDIIQQVATDNGLDPSTLVFTYRVEARDTVVARASDGGFVADVIQLQFVYTDVNDPSGTKSVREAQLYDEYHNDAIGSAFGFEKSKRDSQGNLDQYNFHGKFQYAFPEMDAIYSGTFHTGKALPDTSGQ